MLGWCKIHRTLMGWKEEKKWLIKMTRNKSWQRKLMKIDVAKTIYEIWISQNGSIFAYKPLALTLKDEIIHNILGKCNMYKNLKAYVLANHT